MPKLPNLFACLVIAIVAMGFSGESLSADHSTESDVSRPVELFQAISDGKVNVRFIPVDEKRANVLIHNQTKQPLQIQLPNAIAAVPVLAQFNPQGGGQQGGGGGSQAVGGGFDRGGGGGQIGFGGAQGGGQGNQQLQGGFFRVAPNKTRKVKAVTVCLEHGKPNPNPRIAYKMIPIKEYTKDDRIISLCEDLGTRSIDQRTGQAVAWHLANEMGWKALASVNQLESRYLGNVPFFQKAHLKNAKAYVEELSKTPDSDLYAN